MSSIDFETHPDRYVHWQLRIDGAVAHLQMNVNPDRGFRDGYKLKLNSYDLGVDIELADVVQRLRFEHPEVRCVVVSSANPRVFCAGANISMLATSSHGFKVNFCKFTNETRCGIEDASRHSGQRWVAAVNGTASGGGYELALACDEIYLVDDGNAAVSFPEVPLLGVLPGTGGLTRLVDKRKIRRDRADVFSTLAEGFKAKRALEWKFIDGFFPRSKFDAKIAERVSDVVAKSAPRATQGITLTPLNPTVTDDARDYAYVSTRIDRALRVAELTVRAPTTPQPTTAEGIEAAGASFWALQAFRELDDALCHLRFDVEDVGLVLVKTRGDMNAVLAMDATLAALRSHWLVNEIVRYQARVLRRLDNMARSLFAVADAESAFGGVLLELALASDRVYMLEDPKRPVKLAVGPSSGGALPMSNGLTRLQQRFLAEPAVAETLARDQPVLDTKGALDAGLVTSAPDELDWDDELRVAIEERVSLSPDALTGMEASLRNGGPETQDTKIYGRLSAWQNWIFTRPNATGEHGALKQYGQPERPKFDWRRT